MELLGDLRSTLVLQLEKPLIGLLTLKTDFLNKIILVLYTISCDGDQNFSFFHLYIHLIIHF